MYIAFEEAKAVLTDILSKYGFSGSDAALLADVFARNTLEGVASHGINRFPKFMSNVKNGQVKPGEKAETVSAFGGLEVWDGRLAAGPLTATAATERACALAEAHGIGCVAVGNGNHWMRPGRYGFQMVERGMIGLLWTNTCRNMHAWGAKDAHLGNNPFVLAIPRDNGPVVVDMSMGQIAYGKLELAKLEGKRLPMPGGYDKEGNLTDDPGAILESFRILPMGYWKGSSMALALDMIAAGLSMGRTTEAIGLPAGGEWGLSQVFIAIHYQAVADRAKAQERFDQAVDALLQSQPQDETKPMRYPGQNIKRITAENRAKGLYVHEDTWSKVLSFKEGV